jgi:hypothetical protein
MTIIDFYQELSDMLESARAGRLSKESAVSRLNQMLEEAHKQGIEVEVSPEVFEYNNLVRFDDERSYVEEEYSYDEESEYDSSYDEDQDN